MKQIWITRPGKPDVLELREAPDPSPGPGEVLVAVRAAGVNFADTMARVGKYADAPPLPCVVGYEIAGEVVGVGPQAAAVGETAAALKDGPADAGAGEVSGQRFAPGDRVFGLTRFGGYSSMVSVPAGQLYRIPDGMTDAQAAALPVNYFTAWLAVRLVGNAQAGENVLVHNAGGGVGVAALQLARHAGARVFGTSSGWKHERLRELGADGLIDYTATDWVAEINRMTGGPAMHVVVDPVGGRNLKRDLDVMAPLARLVAFGFSEPVRAGDRPLLPTLRSLLGMPRPHMLRLLSNNWSIGGLNLGHLWTETMRMRRIGEAVLHAWNDGAIVPEIAATFPFEQAAEAHRMLGERRNLGKVLLAP